MKETGLNPNFHLPALISETEAHEGDRLTATVKADEVARTRYTDRLTGLPTRELITNTLEELHRIQDNVGVLFLDLDKFKDVNDTHGHNVGDKVLFELSQKLLSVTRSGDVAGFVGRWGGDEFIIGLNLDPSPESDNDTRGQKTYDAEQKMVLAANRFQRLIDEYTAENEYLQGLEFGMSVGAAIWKEGETLEEFIDRADQLMYRDKALRKAHNGY